MGRTANDLIEAMRSFLGFSEYNRQYKQIIDIYNSHPPLARGYRVQYTDEWCDTTVSAAAIKAGLTDLIGTECGCEEHVKIFKKKGIWIEDGTVCPKPGYIAVYSWKKATQPNDAYATHIGVVEYVQSSTFTVIEGNKENKVTRRTIPIGWGYIRGFAAPKYEEEETPKKSVDEVAREVLNGLWGNGTDRRNRLTKEGYDYKAVQQRVNELSVKACSKNTVSDGTDLNRTPRWVGKVTADHLNVRKGAGKENARIESWPSLKKGDLVDVCDTIKAKDGNDWYYICIAGHIYGFVSVVYITRA